MAAFAKTDPAPFVALQFKALSDETRLRLLVLLLRAARRSTLTARKGICVCDLTTSLGVSQPTASRHLAYLRRAKLVTCRKDGLWCYYSLAEPAGPVHERLLAAVDAFAELSEVSTLDLERLDLCGRGECC